MSARRPLISLVCSLLVAALAGCALDRTTPGTSVEAKTWNCLYSETYTIRTEPPGAKVYVQDKPISGNPATGAVGGVKFNIVQRGTYDIVQTTNLWTNSVKAPTRAGETRWGGLAPDTFSATYTVTAVKEGYKPATRQIVIRQDDPAFISALGTPTPNAEGRITKEYRGSRDILIVLSKADAPDSTDSPSQATAAAPPAARGTGWKATVPLGVVHHLNNTGQIDTLDVPRSIVVSRDDAGIGFVYGVGGRECRITGPGSADEFMLYAQVPVRVRVSKYANHPESFELIAAYSGVDRYHTETHQRFDGTLRIHGTLSGKRWSIEVDDTHGFGLSESAVPIFTNLAVGTTGPAPDATALGHGEIGFWHGNATVDESARAAQVPGR